MVVVRLKHPEMVVICRPILHALPMTLEEDCPTVEQEGCCGIRGLPLIPPVIRWSTRILRHHPMAKVLTMLVHCPIIPLGILPWVVAR